MKSGIILQAAILGMNAYKKGKKAIPCLDIELLKLIGENDSMTVQLLDAWLESWHDANLSSED